MTHRSKKLPANVMFPADTKERMKTSALMPRILGHYVPLRFHRSESVLLYLAENIDILGQTFLRGALCA
jgi:hypothetical protein